MKRVEVKKMILESLSDKDNTKDSWKKLEEAGVTYSFGDDFHGKVMDRLYSAGVTVNREVEFLRSWNSAFFRIALTGIAAIVILLITLYLAEGSFSLNSILGLSDSYDESIVCMLTGN